MRNENNVTTLENGAEKRSAKLGDNKNSRKREGKNTKARDKEENRARGGDM